MTKTPWARRPRYFNVPGTWAQTLWFCQCSWCQTHGAIEQLLSRGSAGLPWKEGKGPAPADWK